MNRIKLAVLGAAALVPAASILLASAAGQNLVANGHFTSGVAGWDNFSGNPQPENGAMKVTNNYQGTGNSYYSGWYCVSGVQAGTKYATRADIFVPQAAAENAGASIGLHYYASNDCSGSNLGGGLRYTGFKPQDRGKWVTLSMEDPAPATAKSVRVRASAVKEPKPSSSGIPGVHAVLFDNVYFGETSKLVIVIPDPTQPPADDPQVNQPVDPTPEPETPADPPANESAGEQPAPAADASPSPTPSQPTPAPQPQTTPGPASDGPQTANSNDSPAAPAAVPGAPTIAPLPPATGEGEPSSSRDTLVFGASISAVLAGLGLLALAARKRSKRA